MEDTECLLCHTSLSASCGRLINKEIRKLLQDYLNSAVFGDSTGDVKVCLECVSYCEELYEYYVQLQKIQEAIQKVVESLKARLAVQLVGLTHNETRRNRGTRSDGTESFDGNKTIRPDITSPALLKPKSNRKSNERLKLAKLRVPSVEVADERDDLEPSETILGIDSSVFCSDIDEGRMLNTGTEDQPVEGHAEIDLKEAILMEGTVDAEDEIVLEENVDIKEEILIEENEGVKEEILIKENEDIKEEILIEENEDIKEEILIEENEDIKEEVLVDDIDVKEEVADESSMDFDDIKEFNLHEVQSDSDSGAEFVTEDKEPKTIKSTIRDILRDSKGTPSNRKQRVSLTHAQTLRDSECELCDPKKIFPSTVTLSKHYEMDHRDTERVFLCERFGCEEKLLTFELLEIHKKSHHSMEGRAMTGTPMYHRAFCNFCQLSSFFPDELRNHELETHLDVLQYKCHICGLKYYNECVLKAHKLIHSEYINDLECWICSDEWKVVYPDVQSYESHIIRMHNFHFDYLRTNLHKKFPKKRTDEDRSITCSECGIVFPKGKRANFLMHKCQRKRFGYQCELCNQDFSNKRASIAHAAVKHEGEKNKSQWNPHLKCQKCGKQFVTTLMYKRHMNCHNLEEKFEFYCGDCEERFATESLFSDHKQFRHHPETDSVRISHLIVCDECGKCFPTTIRIRKHEREEHPHIFTYVCTKCDATFSKSEFLETHLRTHEAVGPYVCSLCPKIFHSTGEELEAHLKKAHTVGCGKTCPTCGEVFPEKASLAVHRSAKHGEAKFMECSMCSKRFNNSSGLKKHAIMAHGSEEMKRKKAEKERGQCEICLKWFTKKYGLQSHIKTVHEKSSVSVCEICGKSISTAHSMKDHMKGHREEKNFACYFCDKRFVRSGVLRMHTYTHTGEKPFGCYVCKKRFNQRTPLTRHIETHKKDGTWFPKPTEEDISKPN